MARLTVKFKLGGLQFDQGINQSLHGTFAHRFIAVQMVAAPLASAKNAVKKRAAVPALPT